MISIILPMVHEEAVIAQTLERLLQQEGSYEIIVVDGGSQDRSAEIARSYPVSVLTSEKGRAIQMNRGALEAKGEIFLFLHADSWLEKGSLIEIENTMKDQEVAGGCLTQKIEAPNPFYRVLEASGTLRARGLHLFYGDQAIFIRKRIFDKLKGYPPMPLFEDLALSQRLKLEGKTAVLSKQVFTSARRWENKGMFRGSLRNMLLVVLYGMGIAPQTLAKFYSDVR